MSLSEEIYVCFQSVDICAKEMFVRQAHGFFLPELELAFLALVL